MIFLWNSILGGTSTLERFPVHNKIILKCGSRMISGKKGERLTLTDNKQSSQFFIVNNPNYDRGIQLESCEWPGYFLTIQHHKPYLKSIYDISSVESTVFEPIGNFERKEIILMNPHTRYYIHQNAVGNDIGCQKYLGRNNIKPSELIRFRVVSN